MASSPLEKPVHPVPTAPGPEELAPVSPPAAGSTLRIGPTDHGRTMTLEEFRQAEEEEGYRYELGRGVLDVTEVPGDLHGQVVTNLYRAIGRFEADHPRVVRRYGGGSEFHLWLPGLVSGRNPDFAVVLHGTPRNSRGRRPPCLVAEVVSRKGEDRGDRVKRAEYLAYGLLEYWIVDPGLRQVTVLTRDGDTWSEQVIRDHEVIPTLVLPGLATTAVDLWTDTEDDEEDSEPNNA